MTNPVAAVFETPELLEMILLTLADDIDDTRPHLIGLQTLLLSQGVNHMFRSLIATSPLLQRALYFRATAPSNDPVASAGPSMTSAANPLLSLKKIVVDSAGSTIAINWRIHRGKVHIKYTRARPSKGLKVVQQEASWRRMLVCQPLFARTVRWSSVGWDHRCKSLTVDAKYKAGTTLGDLVDGFRAWERADKAGLGKRGREPCHQIVS